MPWYYGIFICFYVFVKKIIKKILKKLYKKIVAIHNAFKEKTTKFNFQPT
jgi:hypothetical protein